MIEHRWSGWPGAWCLDCGNVDPAEECLATHDRLSFVCSKCVQQWPQGPCEAGGLHNVIETPCEDHPLTDCPEPNSHNYDPYYKGPVDDQGTAVQKDGNE